MTYTTKPIVLLSFIIVFFQYYSIAQVSIFNDEFDNAPTLSNWSNINDTEGWNAEHLEAYDVDNTAPGRLYMMPYTSVWYQDYRGTLLYKMMEDDFVFTTEVEISNRAENGIPSSQFSLGGMMIRAPRDFPNGAAGAGGWTPGQEDYVFLALGYATGSGPHFEVKTTNNSNSSLNITEINTQTVQIRMARIDGAIIVLYRVPGQSWVVHRRYNRSDLPDEVQIGFVSYTNWEKGNTYSYWDQNSNVLNSDLDPNLSSNPNLPFNPDLKARFDFARFDEVELPAMLNGVDLVNAASDGDLLGFLGYDSTPFCPLNLNINLPIQNQLLDIQAVENIIADNVISDANIRYAAGDGVELMAGFEVVGGAEVLVEIGGCN